MNSVLPAPRTNRASIEHIAQKLQVPLTLIGEVKQGEGLVVMDAQGREMDIEKTGYDHFAS